MNRSPIQLPSLRIISDPIRLSALQGTDATTSSTLFTSSPEDFDKWIKKPGADVPTGEIIVRVHELTDFLLPAQVFETCSSGILWNLCLTRGQAELFLRENQRYLSGPRTEVSFLIREGSHTDSHEPCFVRVWNYKEGSRQVFSHSLQVQQLLWQWDTRFVLPDIVV